MPETTSTREDGKSSPTRVAEEASQKASEIKRVYAHGEDRPMGGHLLLTVAYNALVAAFLLVRTHSGKALPEHIGAGDLLLVGVATHRLSRTASKDRVTAPLRAPFTELEGEGGPGEVEEKPRGRGLRRAIGELLVCPFCMTQWIATGLLAGLAVFPRLTRFVSSMFAAVAIGDFLHVLYKGSEEKLL